MHSEPHENPRHPDGWPEHRTGDEPIWDWPACIEPPLRFQEDTASPAVGGSSDGPEPDANSGKGRNAEPASVPYVLGMILLGLSFVGVLIGLFFLVIWIVEQVSRWWQG